MLGVPLQTSISHMVRGVTTDEDGCVTIVNVKNVTTDQDRNVTTDKFLRFLQKTNFNPFDTLIGK